MSWMRNAAIAAGSAAIGWAAYRRATMLDLAGKCVVISGGSRGLGLEMAREFLDGGARVALLARDPEELERARAALIGWAQRPQESGPVPATQDSAGVTAIGAAEDSAEIKGAVAAGQDSTQTNGAGAVGQNSAEADGAAAAGQDSAEAMGAESTPQRGVELSDVIIVPCDVRDPASAVRAADDVLAVFPQIDILANVAGIIDVAPYDHLTPEDYRDSLDTHFWGPMNMIRAVVGRMSPGSRIINISSIGGLVSVPHLLPYSVGKFALTGYSEGLHPELARRGIHVTTVCPGLMRTGSHVRARFKGRHRQEFAWFAASSGSPLASISARKAARKIVQACRMARPFLILTPQARALQLMHALAPNSTAHAMRLATQLLPEPADEADAEADRTREGWESTSEAAPSILTRRADRAIERNNELPDGQREQYFATAMK